MTPSSRTAKPQTDQPDTPSPCIKPGTLVSQPRQFFRDAHKNRTT